MAGRKPLAGGSGESPRITVRVPERIDQLLRAHPDGTSVAVREAVERAELLEHLLAAELARVRLSLNELGMLADVLNGSWLLPTAVALGGSLGRCATEVADAIQLDGPEVWAQKWGIDPDTVVGRLARLGPAADLALAEAVGRWWTTGQDHTVAGWAAVGVAAV